MSTGLSYASYMVRRDGIDSGVSKVRMDVHWTVLCVLHGTEGRDRDVHWTVYADKVYTNNSLCPRWTCRSPKMDRGFRWQTWTRVTKLLAQLLGNSFSSTKWEKPLASKYF